MRKLAIQFEHRKGDLDSQPEMWKKMTYKERLQRLEQLISEKKENKLPGKLQKIVKMASVTVTPSVDIYDLRPIADYIYQQLGMECFQISIDRKNGKAYFLLDNINHETGRSIVINKSRVYYIHAFIVKSLGLPRGEDDKLMMRYYLVNDYNENPCVFNNANEEVKQKGLSHKASEVISDSLTYVRMVCEGLCK